MMDQIESCLLGVELGRSKVRLALVDGQGRELLNIIQRPIAKTGGPRDPLGQEQSMRAALEAGLGSLGFQRGMRMEAAATIGFANCGVGSGPAMGGWLEQVSTDLGEPVVHAGHHGISYAPARCVELVEEVFVGTGLRLTRVELAPVAVARVLDPRTTASLTMGSGIAWSARILQGEVLEAFEEANAAFDEPLRLTVNGLDQPLRSLGAVGVDEGLCRSRGIPIDFLGPAVGAALSFVRNEDTNLLYASTVFGPSRSGRARQVPDRQPAEGDTYQLQRPVAERPADRVADRRPADQRPPDRRPADQRPPDRRPVDRVAEGRPADRRSAEGRPADRVAEGRPADRRSAPAGARAERQDRGPARSGGQGRRRRSPVDQGPGSELYNTEADYDDLAGIEAFAHPGDSPPRTFHLPEFLLGAATMLILVAVVLFLFR